MSAKIISFPTRGERATHESLSKRRAILARPDVQEQLEEVEALLSAHHRNRLLSETVDMPRNPRR